MSSYIITSESVTEGHPDKIADKISDAVLDDALRQDEESKVACETMVTTGLVMVAGEITTKGYMDIPKIVRDTIRDIGYNSSDMGFDANTCGIITSIDHQSPDIAMGVNKENPEQMGAGDQGMMYGYACDETDTYMPAPIYYAHLLSESLAFARRTNVLDFLRPDGKTQVSVLYENGIPKKITDVVIAAQHKQGYTQEYIKNKLIDVIINPDLHFSGLFDINNCNIFVNATGNFVIGGPVSDCGMTGRKIIQDTYGGIGRHGGGAFSGKDPSKVDRSGAYMARYIAKNIVATKLAKKCELQIAYCIGVAEPVSVYVNTFGTSTIDDDKWSQAIRHIFNLTPYGIITSLQLKRPIYSETTCYGHFGREKENFTWEKTDKIEQLIDFVGK